MAKRSTTPTKGRTAAKPSAAPKQSRAAAKCFTSPKISVANLAPGFKRADIEFHAIDHSGASFEGRVFLNNPQATEKTPRTPAQGYAGSFHIFGHGGCWGDPGHCDILTRRPYDPRPGHPLTPGKKTLIATAAVQRALKQGREITVTVVPVVREAPERVDAEDVLHFERLQIVTYS
jgi:hypothetical protein